jgi:ERF superfamily protein
MNAPAEVVTTLPAVPPLGGGLVAAIAAVMNEVHVVAKRGENEFHRYRYATMGDILKEITPLLGRHGIVIFQSETGRAMFDDDNVIAVEYSFTVAHASGETWPHVIKQTGVSTCRNSKGGWDDKSLNKCHTAARKYFLLALFQIPTGEEADADHGEHERDTRDVPAVVRRVQSITPRTIVPAPKRALKQGGITDRAMVARAHREWQRPAGPSQPFRASEAGRSDDPPPHDFIPDSPGEAARALNRSLHPMNDELPGDLGPPKAIDTSERDGVPAFLDRRKANGDADHAAEPSYLDLVGR